MEKVKFYYVRLNLFSENNKNVSVSHKLWRSYLKDTFQRSCKQRWCWWIFALVSTMTGIFILRFSDFRNWINFLTNNWFDLIGRTYFKVKLIDSFYLHFNTKLIISFPTQNFNEMCISNFNGSTNETVRRKDTFQ